MNTDKLNKLADTLEVIEPEAFDLGTWWEQSDQTVCGTAGCICGWAVMSDVEAAADHKAWQTSYPTSGTRRQILSKYDVPVKDYVPTQFPWTSVGEKLLGLTVREGDALFTEPAFWGQKLVELGLRDADDDEIDEGHINLSDVTVKEAIVVLRALASGEVELDYKTRCDCDACWARR